jgi:hypothetical protein
MKTFRLGTEVLFTSLFVAFLTLAGCITIKDCRDDNDIGPPGCATTMVPPGGAGGCSSGTTCTNPGTMCAPLKKCKNVNVNGVCSCECLR